MRVIDFNWSCWISFPAFLPFNKKNKPWQRTGWKNKSSGYLMEFLFRAFLYVDLTKVQIFTACCRKVHVFNMRHWVPRMWLQICKGMVADVFNEYLYGIFLLLFFYVYVVIAMLNLYIFLKKKTGTERMIWSFIILMLPFWLTF